MNSVWPYLETVLRLCGGIQLGIAALNLFLSGLLGWKEDVARMPLLIREVFQVHAWFISLTLAIFAIMTWRFAQDMAAGTNDALRWLAAGIGSFWAFRTVLQVTYYSSNHWRGKPLRTAIHVALFTVYGGLAGSYLCAALGRNGPVKASDFVLTLPL